MGFEGARAALLWAGSIPAFQQMLAHGVFCFKNRSKSMASLGSEAKSLGNGCDLLASGWLELQACSESGQKRGGRTREGRAQPQLAEAGGDVTQAPCSICRSFWGPQPSGVTFGVVLLLTPARCPRRGTAHGTALLCPSGNHNQSFVALRVQAAAPKDTAGLKANPGRLLVPSALSSALFPSPPSHCTCCAWAGPWGWRQLGLGSRDPSSVSTPLLWVQTVAARGKNGNHGPL